ncbi:MAG: ABC transporter substrate-binding protein, partial [Flavobacteriales bacterium]|nr:ABC transporter substrate-binding protein [Flavobacteriales bacterium]
MTKILRSALYFLLAVTLWACPSTQEKQAPGFLIGGAYRGGTFYLNEVEEFQSLYPLSVTDVASFRTANQIYEGLVKFDQSDLSIIPCIAEKWEISPDAKTFKFYLRKGVKYHENSCFDNEEDREVTADDFVYCFTQLCTASPNNQMFWLFDERVAGASEFYKASINQQHEGKSVSGIKALDRYTLQIELDYPFSGFLNVLAHPGCWVYPQEALEEYEKELSRKAVGTGPFMIDRIVEGSNCRLKRNPDYWRQDSY